MKLDELDKKTYELYGYYKGKRIDSKTYEEEKKLYGLSESETVYYEGYPDSEITLKLSGNEVVYQHVDLGMGRAHSTAYSFDSEGEALAWMIYIMRRNKDYIKNNEHLQINGL